jgi:hypothetical protein
LLEQIGVGGDLCLAPIAGGANGRAYRVKLGGQHFLLKQYFQHPSDNRDRLGAEFALCEFAWSHGITAVPRPYARDKSGPFGLYEFIAGTRIGEGSVGWREVRQALEFYQELNRWRTEPGAAALPKASEAFFRLADHLDRVEDRVQRLRRIDRAGDVDREAAEFVDCSLYPAWLWVREAAERSAHRFGLPLFEEISARDRCLSPSDFGFHNALLAEDGRVRFFDFEYAGWDDPAKMVCDFFCQVAVPVPFKYHPPFVDTVAGSSTGKEHCLKRASVLLPVYRIKWCCIVLNDFLPSVAGRRSFADPSSALRNRKIEQLDKARRLLAQLESQEKNPCSTWTF